MTRMLTLLLLTVACQGPIEAEPSRPDAVEAAADTPEAFAAALIQTLTVSLDGGLAFRDEAGARALLGKDFPEAARELAQLNASIAVGTVPPFRDDTALLDYELVEDDAELQAGHAPAAATRCRGACVSGMCCVSGWWIFCWGYGTC